MNRRASLSFLLSTAVVACAAPAGAPARGTTIPTPALISAPAPDPEDPALVATVVHEMPDALTIDGDLVEWGSLDPSPPRPEEKRDPKRKRTTVRAPSHIAVALAPNEVALAADLRQGAARGVWLALRFASAEVPAVGTSGPDGRVVPFDCDKDPDRAGGLAECRALVKEHDALAASLAQRFERVYRIDGDGVRRRLSDGKLQPVQTGGVLAANIHVEHLPEGLRVEAILPLTVLPAVVGATVDSVELAARPVSAEPKFAEEIYVASTLQSAVGFDPSPELRARVMELLPGHLIPTYYPGDILMQTYGYRSYDSYEPPDPRRVEVKEAPLYAAQRTFGNVEIGDVFGNLAFAVLRAGKVVAVTETGPESELRGMVERDGQLQIFRFAYPGSSDGMRNVSWNVVAIGPDGAQRSDLFVSPGVALGTGVLDDSHATDFSTLGFRLFTDEHRNEIDTYTWRYDKKQKKYVGPAVRHGASPRRANATR